MPSFFLRMTEAQRFSLQAHLFPGDGKEAVALLLCGRRNGSERHVLMAREVVAVPHHLCRRTPDNVTWPTHVLDPLLTKAYGQGQAIVKVHSHPTGYERFSTIDDYSDRSVFASVWSLLDDELPHASVVMLPDGAMFGRMVGDGVIGDPFESIMVVGDDIKVYGRAWGGGGQGFALRHAQAFGKGTIERLRSLSVVVVGCSGTGSIVVEQLARLGVGRIVLIDPDFVEEKNLNRILNTGKEDAYLNRPKVQALASAIARMGLGTEVVPMVANLDSTEAVLAVAECDVAFGCMDGVEGRHLLNRITTFYSIPYFDVGVRLDADGHGGISGIAGAVNYLQPGGSSLLSRGLYTKEHLKAEEMRRTNPEMYERQRKEGYLRGIVEDRPAVISVNMFYAALAVNEFLARIHPYRNNENYEYAHVAANLSEMHFILEPEEGDCELLKGFTGRGDMEPLLRRQSLG